MTSSHMSRLSVSASAIATTGLRRMVSSGDAYLDHALIWALFPGEGLPRGFVFRRMRMESDRRNYLIVSSRPPVSPASGYRCESKPYQPAPAPGTWLRFELRANPTISRKDKDGKSRRHDVLADARCTALSANEVGQHTRPSIEVANQWLLDRADRLGLQVDAKHLQADNYIQHWLRHRGRTIQFSSVDYSGIVRVEDTDRLAAALTYGVGHSKGFGCGLLLVRRLP